MGMLQIENLFLLRFKRQANVVLPRRFICVVLPSEAAMLALSVRCALEGWLSRPVLPDSRDDSCRAGPQYPVVSPRLATGRPSTPVSPGFAAPRAAIRYPGPHLFAGIGSPDAAPGSSQLSRQLRQPCVLDVQLLVRGDEAYGVLEIGKALLLGNQVVAQGARALLNQLAYCLAGSTFSSIFVSMAAWAKALASAAASAALANSPKSRSRCSHGWDYHGGERQSVFSRSIIREPNAEIAVALGRRPPFLQ